MTKLSYNDLVRRNRAIIALTENAMTEISHTMHLERIAKEVLLAIITQVADGQMTKGELGAWLIKFNSPKMRELRGQELADYLDVPNLIEVLRDIEQCTLSELNDMKIKYLSALP